MTGAAADRVRVDLRDGVADVRLNRPDKMNALDPAMFAALTAAGERLAGEAGLRAVVLSGEGTAFCAGLDMASFAAMSEAGADAAIPRDLTVRTHGRSNLFQHVALAWRELPVPVIAAIQGAAFGGGLQIALGADLRFVAPDARLSVMEIRWGLVPDMGGIVLLRSLLRADVARDLAFTGRVVSGRDAVEIGLATRLETDPREAALSAAREIASRSPDAIRAAKRLLNTWDSPDAQSILLAESREQQALIGSHNQAEAVRANVERRSPVFRDADGISRPQGRAA